MKNTLSLGRSLLITSFVAIGIASAWFLFGSWFEGILQSAMQGREPYETVYLNISGEPVVVRTSNGNTQTTEKILSLNGEPANVTSQDLLYLQSVSRPAARLSGELEPLAWQNRLSAANDGGIPPAYWYLVHDGQQPGHAYGIGFHAPTRKITGYFGRNGFTDTLPPREQWFAIPGRSGMSGVTTSYFYGQEPVWSGANPRMLLLADGKLWKIDLAKRQVNKLLDCPEAYRVGQAWRILENPPKQSTETEQRVASSLTPQDGFVREPESILIVNPQSGENKRYSLPAELRRHMLAAAQLPGGDLVLITQLSYETDQQVVWLTSSGEIARQQTIPRKARQRQGSLAAVGWWWALEAPLPLVNAGANFGWMPLMLSARDESDEIEESYSQALGRVLRQTWPSMLAVVVISCVTAVLAYRRQKRFGLPYPVAWAVFAFVGGVPGWIAYRFHRVWPVLEECPACRQPSPRDRVHCLDCGKAFPGPALKGIEVFA